LPLLIPRQEVQLFGNVTDLIGGNVTDLIGVTLIQKTKNK